MPTPNEEKNNKKWLATISVAIISGAVIILSSVLNDDNSKHDSLEKMRTHIHTWLSETVTDSLTMTTSNLKETILDDWANQNSNYEIVSLRKPNDYRSAGHIPNAINIYWVDILTDENLARLGSGKILVLYCYYGHASMLSATILSLLGYKCYSLDFGMMNWNLDAVVKEPWDKEADYEVETIVRDATEEYPVPDLDVGEGDMESMIMAAAQKYFGTEGSPIIRPGDVKTILDNWADEANRNQILDVRSKKDYERGHVPNAISIPLAEIAERKNLAKLDPARTVILCSENGQTGQLATTVLNLLGYRAVNMLFGMMDWNTAHVDPSDQWNTPAAYTVER